MWVIKWHREYSAERDYLQQWTDGIGPLYTQDIAEAKQFNSRLQAQRFLLYQTYHAGSRGYEYNSALLPVEVEEIAVDCPPEYREVA